MSWVLVALVIPIAGMLVSALGSYFFYRSRREAIDVLRVYAERGEEPPEKLLEALTGGKPTKKSAKLAGSAAASAMTAIGFGVLSFWSLTQGHMVWWIVLSAVIAIGSAASAAGAAMMALRLPRDNG